MRQTSLPGTTGRRSVGPGSDRPSAVRPVRPGRRGIGAVAVGLAVLGVLAAAWGFARAGLPAPLPGFAVNGAGSVTESASASAAPGPGASPATPAPGAVAAAVVPTEVQSQLASADPEEAVRGLARLRSLAFSSGDFALLQQVNVPASAAAAADGRISARLEESGRVLAGFTTLLSDVAEDADPLGNSGRSVAVVAVTASTSAYQERDANGAVLADAVSTPEQQLRLVLATVEGRWRIQDILPAAGAPAGAAGG